MYVCVKFWSKQLKTSTEVAVRGDWTIDRLGLRWKIIEEKSQGARESQIVLESESQSHQNL